MGTYLSEPKTDKKTNLLRFQNCFVTTCEMQGWRKQMEDAIICQQLAPGIEVYGVFDGHGGPQVSTFVSRHFAKQLSQDPTFKQRNYCQALLNTFRKIDDQLKSTKGEEQLKKIHLELKIPFDQHIQQIGYKAGCTANVLLVTKEKIFVANLGDSRSVLCKKGVAIALSQDHKPQTPSEKERINASGAYIKNGRINGGVNLSRAFGDFQYKSIPNKKPQQQPVISIPQIRQIQRSFDDNFIVIGCDGIWQRYVNNNQKMIDYIKEFRQKHKDKKVFIETFVHSLIGKNVKQPYGLDNMSVIVLDFV